MHSDDIKYIYFLTLVENLGNVRINSLLKHFRKPSDIFQASLRELLEVNGINKNIATAIRRTLDNINELERTFEELNELLIKKKIKVISIKDKEYPENLKFIYDPPVLLFYKGNLTSDDKFSISIVGTRFPTEYGKTICHNIASELAKIGIPIVSGMARGIDTVAHKSAIEKSGITYAILGSGVDVVYPMENKKVYERIIESGAVISEFIPGTKPDKVNFPLRNRLISGISLGTVIVETGLRGGSLITASCASDQDREIFAIPGHINSKKSEGTNDLIKKGYAKLITSAEDILLELESKFKYFKKLNENQNKILTSDELSKNIELNIFEKRIFDVINNEPIHIDKISELTSLSISDCLVNLLSLEFKGLIRQIPGKNFVRV
ncbi:MAG: DNA-processing protein DprA [Ignavibacteria bacterium]|nr:DNA-processing protein DprA [Ignavibacteria bacterium]